MNVLVPLNSSVGVVAVWTQPDMGSCWKCDETSSTFTLKEIVL